MTRDIALDLILPENEVYLSTFYQRPTWATSDWERYPENPGCLKLDLFRFTSCVSADDTVSGFLYFRFDDFLCQHAVWGVSDKYWNYFDDSTRPCRVDTVHWQQHVDKIGFRHRVYLGQGLANRRVPPVWAGAGWLAASQHRLELADAAALNAWMFLPVEADPRLAGRADADKGEAAEFAVHHMPFTPAPAFADWKKLEEMSYNLLEVPLSAIGWEVTTLCAKHVIGSFPFKLDGDGCEKVQVFPSS